MYLVSPLEEEEEDVEEEAEPVAAAATAAAVVDDAVATEEEEVVVATSWAAGLLATTLVGAAEAADEVTALDVYAGTSTLEEEVCEPAPEPEPEPGAEPEPEPRGTQAALTEDRMATRATSCFAANMLDLVGGRRAETGPMTRTG